jgi:hypothetical protein
VEPDGGDVLAIDNFNKRPIDFAYARGDALIIRYLEAVTNIMASTRALSGMRARDPRRGSVRTGNRAVAKTADRSYIYSFIARTYPLARVHAIIPCSCSHFAVVPGLDNDQKDEDSSDDEDLPPPGSDGKSTVFAVAMHCV